MLVASWLWAVFTIVAAAAQTVRNATQRSLTASLGTVGATHVRFLFGFPFSVIFLVLVMAALDRAPPMPAAGYWPWVIDGAVAQFAATALMLAAMGERSFVVTIAYIKTEPVQVALFGLVLLGDQVTWPMALAIVTATAGVVLMSIKPSVPISKFAEPRDASGSELRNQRDTSEHISLVRLLNPKFAMKFAARVRELRVRRTSAMTGGWKPTLLGLGSGALFGLSAIGYRGAILNLQDPSFVMAATFTLVIGLALQSVLLTAWLYMRDRATLVAIFRAWRPSLFAGFMGALASQFWYLGFAIATAASVRTLALVEVLFAQAISRFVFKQPTTPREALGIVLIVAGVILLLWAY